MTIQLRRPSLPPLRKVPEWLLFLGLTVVALTLILANLFLLLILFLAVVAAVIGPRMYMLDVMKFQMAHGLERWLHSGEAEYGHAMHHEDWAGGTEINLARTRLPQSWRIQLQTGPGLLWKDFLQWKFFRWFFKPQLPWHLVTKVTVHPSHRATPYKQEDWLDEVFQQVAFIMRIHPDRLDHEDDLLTGRLVYTRVPEGEIRGSTTLAEEAGNGE